MSQRIRKEEKEALAGAVRDYDRAIKLKPSQPNACSNRGNARLAQGELREALADFEQAIILQTRPTAENFRDRGRVRAIFGEFEKALADINKAIELAPEFAEPYQRRAEVRKAKGDKAGARADIEQFERLNKAKGANGK